MLFYFSDELLKPLIQADSSGTKNQIVQVLSMFRFDSKASVNVLIDEHVVEYRHVDERAVPCIILEHRRRRSAATIENNMGRMLSRKTSALRHGNGIPRC